MKVRISGHENTWNMTLIYFFFFPKHLTVYDLFLPRRLLMLFTVGLCGLRSALSYICLLRSETSSSFPPVIPVYSPHPSSLQPSHHPCSSFVCFFFLFFFSIWRLSSALQELLRLPWVETDPAELKEPWETKHGCSRMSGLFPASSELSGKC